MLQFLVFLIITLFSITVKGQIPQGEAILQHLETKIYSKNMTFQMRMEVYKAEKLKSNYLMSGYKMEDRFRIEFEEPAVEKGRRLLNDANSLWMYLPRTSKTIRLSNKQSFMGSDASNSDILRVSLRKDYNIDSVYYSGADLVLMLQGKDLELSYYRINVFLNKDNWSPVKQEFLSLSGKVIRTIYYSNYKEISGSLFPMSAVIKDELKKDSKTVLTYYSLSRTCDKSDFFFTTTSLRK